MHFLILGYGVIGVKGLWVYGVIGLYIWGNTAPKLAPMVDIATSALRQ